MAPGRELPARLLAEFRSPEEMLDAVARLRSLGYQHLETYSPFAVPGAPGGLGLGRSRLPWYALAGGIAGATLSYAVQWYANAWDYPLNVGGRPAHAVPAFLIATFEGAILLASLTCFVALLFTLGLPRLWHPLFEVEGFERASVDRFWVAVPGPDSPFWLEAAARALEERGALRVLRLEETG